MTYSCSLKHFQTICNVQLHFYGLDPDSPLLGFVASLQGFCVQAKLAPMKGIIILSRSRRVDPWHQVSFIMPMEDFETSQGYSDGRCPQVKVFIFYQRSEDRDDQRGIILLVHSKFWRVFLLSPLTPFYCILSIIIIICTIRTCSSVGGQALEKCFGVWVRIPSPPIISHYFSLNDQACVQAGRPPCTLIIQPNRCPGRIFERTKVVATDICPQVKVFHFQQRTKDRDDKRGILSFADLNSGAFFH